ncbi:GNAT family N-acetyltransferase [Parasphingorhabdus pacifica]
MIEFGALLCVAGIALLVFAGMRDGSPALHVLTTVGAALLGGIAARRWRSRRPDLAGTPDPDDLPPSGVAAAPDLAGSDVAGPDGAGPDVAAAEFAPGEVAAGASRGRALWRLRASVIDSPGRLARIASGLAALGGNIRTVQVQPVPGGAVDEVLLHVPSKVTADELGRAVERAGGRQITVRKADVRELDDLPTRTINLARELVAGRCETLRTLRALLGEVDVRWMEESESPMVIDDLADRTMCLRAPGGGVLLLERTTGSFTPSEFARARAMAELAAGCDPRPLRDGRTVTTRQGTELTVRTADRDDLSPVAAFHERCSKAALYRRYRGSGPAESRLLRLLTPSLGRSLVVEISGGEVVALGTLAYEGDSGEIALLVHDDWQGRGIGTLLAREVVAVADSLGLASLEANTQVDDLAIAGTLRAAGFKVAGVPEPGEWCWTRSPTRTSVIRASPAFRWWSERTRAW